MPMKPTGRGRSPRRHRPVLALNAACQDHRGGAFVEDTRPETGAAAGSLGRWHHSGMRGAANEPPRAGHGKWHVQAGFDLDGFLGQPLVARVATVGPTWPTVRPLWYLWEEHAFWWLTGEWSRLGQLLDHDPRVALVVDTCDLRSGEVLQVMPGERRR